MKASLTISAALVLSVPLATGQDASAGQSGASVTRFEVASVKECQSGEASSSSAGRLSLGCRPLRMLIQEAYDLFAAGRVDPLNPATPVIPIEGLPAWVNRARYSIDAKTESPQTAAMMRGPLMQALLEDRFHMRLRRENREGPIYLMTVAKGGLKLSPAKEGSCAPFDFSEAINMKPSDQTWCAVPKVVRRGATTVVDVHGVTLAAFAKLLHPEGRPVFDRTGIAGVFEIHLEWDDQPDPAGSAGGGVGDLASDPAPHSSAIAATRQQLGLELKPDRGMHQVLVVDRIEKPSGN